MKRKKKRRMKKILLWSISKIIPLAIIFLCVFLIGSISKMSGGRAQDSIRLPVEATGGQSADATDISIMNISSTNTEKSGMPSTNSLSENSYNNTSMDTTAGNAVMGGTGENDMKEAESNTATTTTIETKTDIAAKETTAPQETETTTMSGNASNSPLNAADFANYSTEKVPYGFGADVDTDNRPDGCTWYTNKFSNYTTLFIMPKSSNIYLTFDEGYEYGFTGEILDVLKEKNVKAVFFVTLPYARDNPQLVQRMIDEGHIIGNHTTTHPSGGLQQYDAQKQIDDIDQVTQYVNEHYGYSMNLFRFPEGSFSEQSLAIVNALGYTSVFWSFAYKDWDVNNQPDVSESLANALNKAHGGAIYLLHAESETNTKMLPDLIDGLREKGYSLELLN